jgi:hypothetical protein
VFPLPIHEIGADVFFSNVLLCRCERSIPKEWNPPFFLRGAKGTMTSAVPPESIPVVFLWFTREPKGALLENLRGVAAPL